MLNTLLVFMGQLEQSDEIINSNLLHQPEEISGWKPPEALAHQVGAEFFENFRKNTPKAGETQEDFMRRMFELSLQPKPKKETEIKENQPYFPISNFSLPKTNCHYSDAIEDLID